MAVQILRRTFYKNAEKTILILTKPFNFHSQNPSSRKPSDNMRNYRITTAKVDSDGNHGLFLDEQLAHLPTGNTLKKLSNIAFDEDNTENNYMFVML